MAVCWVVAPCRLYEFNDVSAVCTTSNLIALIMEAIETSETSVNSYQSTRRYNPEDSHPQVYLEFMELPHVFST
jgi:hypothetical protein